MHPGFLESLFRKILHDESSRTQNAQSPCARPRPCSEGVDLVKIISVVMVFHGLFRKSLIFYLFRFFRIGFFSYCNYVFKSSA